MHLRMDRFKTLRWLMVLVGFIYFVERGTEKADRLITHSFKQATTFMLAMNTASAQDRDDAESFQRSLDRHNKVASFVWKRPQGRGLADRPDEFSPKEIAADNKLREEYKRQDAKFVKN